jgi:hypothetical protein
MTRSQFVFLVACVLILCGICGYQFLTGFDSSLRMIFAIDQTSFFEEHEQKAYEKLNQTPPDFVAAEKYLTGIKEYYPSGSKQKVGSAMDRVIEHSRNATIRAITFKIELLKRDLAEQSSTKSPVQP